MLDYYYPISRNHRNHGKLTKPQNLDGLAIRNANLGDSPESIRRKTPHFHGINAIRTNRLDLKPEPCTSSEPKHFQAEFFWGGGGLNSSD